MSRFTRTTAALGAFIAATVVVGAFVVTTALFLAAVLVALGLAAVRRGRRALGPRFGEGHVGQGRRTPPAVIDATAAIVTGAKLKPGSWPRTKRNCSG